EFCASNPRIFRGRRILELGAGVGVTGLLVAACCEAKEMVLTDYAPSRVLANLRLNAEINQPLLESGRQGAAASRVMVQSLDWTDFVPSEEFPLAEEHPQSASTPPAMAATVPPLPPGGPPRPLGEGGTRDSLGGGGEKGSKVLAGAASCMGSGPEASGGEGEAGAVDGGGGCVADAACSPMGDGSLGGDGLGCPEVVLAADVVYDVRF
ncbi:unnamed protein product, partial [Discosporangium mesarthrocarpum]